MPKKNDDYLPISNDSGFIAVLVPEHSSETFAKAINVMVETASESFLAEFPYDWELDTEQQELVRPNISRLILRRHVTEPDPDVCGCEAVGFYCKKGDSLERYCAYGLEDAVIFLNDFYIKHGGEVNT